MFNLEKQQDAHRSAYEAIPRQCAIILDVKSPGTALRNIRTNNQIWDEFAESELIRELSSLIDLSDSVQAFNELISENRIIAFAIPSDNALNWGFIMPLPMDFEETKSLDLIETLEGVTWDATARKGELRLNDLLFQAAFVDGLLLVSSGASLLQSMSNTLANNEGLQNDENFSYAYQVGGKNKVLNIYLQHNQITTWLLNRLSPFLISGLSKLSNMGEWTELDLLLKPNSIQLNGFSVGQIDLDEQDAQNLSRYYEVMSAKTAYYYPTKILKKQFSEQQEILIDSLDKTTHNGLKHLLSECSTYEGLVFANKLGLSEISKPYVAFEKSSAPSLEELLKTCASFDSVLQFPKLFENGLSLPFTDTGAYHINTDNWHIFAADKQAAEDFKATSKRLNESGNFESFSENLLSDAHLSIYFSPFRMSQEIPLFFKEAYLDYWKRNTPFVERFEGFSWQITKETNQRVFHHIYLKYNPDFQEDQSYLWVAKGDAAFTPKLHLFKNHYTGADEILVQDKNHRLHLYNNLGKKLWETKLDAPINSEVYIVDRYKNDKYQILLSTEKSLYLIDRKGRNTEGFPIQIASGLSAGISCMDYDNNKNYRILVPSKEGDIHNFDIDGKKVKGWNYKQSSPVINSPEYFQVGKKDHILILTADGQLRTLDRKGDVRNKVSDELKFPEQVSMGIFAGSTEAKSLIVLNTKDALLQLRLDGKQKKISNLNMNSKLFYSDVDLDKYPEILQIGRAHV